MRGSAPKIHETKYETEAVIHRKDFERRKEDGGSRTFCIASERKSVRFRVVKRQSDQK